MILVVDNYDSFTWNLVQYIGEINPDIEVVRNDSLSATDALKRNPTHIVISPGPCTPKEAGISVELIQKVPANVPLLGVCLGHQCMGAAFGGIVQKAPYLMHGKTSTIRCIATSPLLQNLPKTFTATRYHSLIVERTSLPDELEITAESEDSLIMAMQHRIRPLYGLQFHPESILTEQGKQLIQNFLQIKGQA